MTLVDMSLHLANTSIARPASHERKSVHTDQEAEGLAQYYRA
jgi:hypothetical protein